MNEDQFVIQFKVAFDLTRSGGCHVDVFRKIFGVNRIQARVVSTDMHRYILGDQRLHLQMNLRIFAPELTYFDAIGIRKQ